MCSTLKLIVLTRPVEQCNCLVVKSTNMSSWKRHPKILENQMRFKNKILNSLKEFTQVIYIIQNTFFLMIRYKTTGRLNMKYTLYRGLGKNE